MFSVLFNSALCLLFSTLHSSMSYPTISSAPSFDAVILKIPVPQPQSNTRLLCRSMLRSSEITSLVVSCVPVPNACLASIPILITSLPTISIAESLLFLASYMMILLLILMGLKPFFSHSSFQFCSSSSVVIKVIEAS